MPQYHIVHNISALFWFKKCCDLYNTFSYILAGNGDPNKYYIYFHIYFHQQKCFIFIPYDTYRVSLAWMGFSSVILGIIALIFQ